MINHTPIKARKPRAAKADAVDHAEMNRVDRLRSKEARQRAEITGLRTAKPADKRGPKQGSAMSNQTPFAAEAAPKRTRKTEQNAAAPHGYSDDGAPLSAKEAKAAAKAMVKDEAAPKAKRENADRITGLANERSGPPSLIIETLGGRGVSVVIPRSKLSADLRKLAVEGGSLRAVQEYLASHKPDAKLAGGITGRDAPHASKAVADAKAHTPAKQEVAKAQQTKFKAMSARGDKAYSATAKEDNSKPDTFRRYMISTIRAYKDTAAAKAAHAKSGKFAKERLNFNWAAANGYITFA